MADKFIRRFPTHGGLIIATEVHRDGKPIGQRGGSIAYVKHYLVDDFDTPILDPTCEWFETMDEAIYVARVYAQLVKEKHPCPDRAWHAAWINYCKLRQELPMVLVRLADAKTGKTVPVAAIAEELKKLLDK